MAWLFYTTHSIALVRNAWKKYIILYGDDDMMEKQKEERNKIKACTLGELLVWVGLSRWILWIGGVNSHVVKINAAVVRLVGCRFCLLFSSFFFFLLCHYCCYGWCCCCCCCYYYYDCRKLMHRVSGWLLYYTCIFKKNVRKRVYSR